MRFLVVVAVTLCACTSDDELTVKVDTGTLHGAKSGTIRSFVGIPYAAPPLGDNRFRAPQPAVPWSGVRQALQIGDGCPQAFSIFSNLAGDDEDCLTLNVWTPSGARDLPVMVWIHGGAFVVGSGGDKWYDGGSLAQQGVVIVTLNYRLGALGFMAHAALDTDDPAYPTSGNYGLEDQRFALEWVQRNIRAFGGDPARVTIFGESAGGWSSCLLYLSDRTSGLFAAAISESGLCDAPFTTPAHADVAAAGATLAASLGCTGSDAATVACLRGLSVDAILAATAMPPVSSQPPGGVLFQTQGLGLVPNVDGFVVPATWDAALAARAFEPRPLLLGTNKDEGTLFVSSFLAEPVTDATTYHDALARRFGSANADAIVARYPIASYASPNDALGAVAGDAFFVCPARRTSRAVAGAGAPVFRYSFEHALENPFAQGLGVFHASEIPFVFGNDNFAAGHVGTSGAPLQAAIQAYWTTFAKTYDPGADWPAYDAASDPYQLLDVPVSSQAGLKTSLCDFWDTLM